MFNSRKISDKRTQQMTRLSLIALAMASTALPAFADEVNIYSHRQPELIQPLLDAFTAETGIAVNVAFVDKGMAERLVAEGGWCPAPATRVGGGAWLLWTGAGRGGGGGGGFAPPPIWC